MLTFDRRKFIVPLLIAGLAAAGCTQRERTVSGQPAPGVMADGSIAGIVSAANQGEIEQGRTALSKSRNQSVREFAQRMVSDHTQAESQFRTVLMQANISSAASTTATQLDQNSDQTIETLNDLDETTFDRTYMDSQVSIHEWLLRTLDETLIPSAQNNSMEQQLRSYRTMIASHLEQARSVRRSLGS